MEKGIIKFDICFCLNEGIHKETTSFLRFLDRIKHKTPLWMSKCMFSFIPKESSQAHIKKDDHKYKKNHQSYYY